MEALFHMPLLHHPILTGLGQAFASNVYVSGLVMIMLNVGTSYLMQDLMPLAQRVFAYVWVRRLVFFAIFFTATRDLVASVLLTLAFVLLVDVLLNERSKYCVLPFEWRAHATVGPEATGPGATGPGATEPFANASTEPFANASTEPFANASVDSALVTHANPRRVRYHENAARWQQWHRLAAP